MNGLSQTQLTTGFVTLLVLTLVVRRTLRTQVVSLVGLVLVPIVIMVVAGAAVAASPASSASGTAIAIGALAGAALGYARGSQSRVELGPRPHTLVVKGSPLLVGIILAAFVVRFAVRAHFNADAHVAFAVGNGFLAFAAASVSVARGMLLLTWRRLTASGPAAP